MDTDVVSRTSPTSGTSAVPAWLSLHRGQSSISVATLTELHFGVARLRRRGAIRKSEQLEAWLSDVEVSFANRVHGVDVRVARRAGELLARAEAAGVAPGFADACIAATADLAGFKVITFNAKHFAALGVSFAEPALSAGP